MVDKKSIPPEEEPKIKMYRLKIDVDIEAESIDAARLQAKTRVAELVKTNLGEKVQRVVRKKYSSRADRLAEARSMIEDARAIVDELKVEIEEWRDGLPENLQGGEKYSSLEECASNLESVDSSLDEAESNCDSVEFPGMFG